MKDESELAGVLAHEIAHVTEKHVVKELSIKGSDDSATSGIARIVGGSSDSARAAFAQAVDTAVGMLFKDGYKREDEAQADKTAVAVSSLAGYDPGGLGRYLDRISGIKGKTTAVLDRTHPPFAARTAMIKDLMSAEGLDSGEGRKNTERFAESMKDLK
jgi:predicted Zn-dependent protease